MTTTSLFRATLLSATAGLALLAPVAVAQAPMPSVAETQAAIVGNPLFSDWTAAYGAPPFDQIRPEHFEPAFTHAMALERAEFDAIADNPAPASFENTIEAMERAGKDLGRIGSTFGALTSSATNDELRAIQRDMSPRLAAHNSAIALDADLFRRVDTLFRSMDMLNLSDEQARVLERTHTGFVRAGAKLQGEDRERLAEITESLASLYTQFRQNVLADTEAFTLVLDTDADKAGLPAAVLSAATQAGTDRDMEGSAVITLARSSFEPFMTFSTRRDLREKVWRAWTNRGDMGGETDNDAVIKQILSLRLERANLLGFDNFAAFRTSNTMAGTPEAAHELLSQVWEGALAKYKQEDAEIRAIMDAEGVTHDLEPWDWWHYSEKARVANYNLDEDAVKAFLSLDNVLDAQFAVAERLFGVTFEERDDIPTYHPDVRVWEMTDPDGTKAGLFYGDYFARPGKRGGAWKSALRRQNNLDDVTHPLIMNNTNYNKPAPGQPALISLREAEVIFHEFGHGLHGLLSDVTYPSISGTGVDFDFVEFPAQILEHWMREPAVIQEFALHYETNEPMPTELLDAVRRAGNAKSGFDNVEFIASAFVDLAYHRIESQDVIEAMDVNSFEDGVLGQAGMPHAIEMRHRSPHFGHSFGGELYAGGYYTYMWAGVLDNDGYAAFEEAGDPFDPELAKSLYENVFSAGNSRPAMDAYVAFRGREPIVEPLLTNRGLNVGKPEM
ncbi:MAG: M3 family metallopeptidase [Litorimonas sp.]